MSRREYEGHIIKGYFEGTSREHYDVLEKSAVGDWFADKVASGCKTVGEARQTIREHNADVRSRK